jgi:hypothetical protein
VSLRLLLDEHISSKVAVQIRLKRAEVNIQGIREWLGGEMMGGPDSTLLAAAAQDGLTLVTYDLKSIPLLLHLLAGSGQQHAGLVLIDDRSIASDDFGGLSRALLRLWEETGSWDWTDRVYFLRPTP